jgi:1-aminocyclopropane-1-carboxylate deaminase/D-cysteine desulfhydrase-like pyridoxal-dependent ACC family enzyme
MAPGTNPLFARFPRLAEAFPLVSLGVQRTALEERAVGGRTLLVKRDDVSALPYGGNKVRKLEFILGAARAAGARRLITAGATGSHHALATTVYGRRLGFDVTLVLFPQHRTTHVQDVLLAGAAHGAELRFIRRMESIPYALWRERRAAGARGETSCIVAPGGSDPIGTLGYVAAGLELDEQLEGREQPDAIYVAAGTLGTVAGIALGLALAGRTIPVVGVRITSRLVTNARALHRLIHRTAALLDTAGVPAGAAAARARALVHITGDYVGAGYGHGTAAGGAAAGAFTDAGLTLDPTYTAKAAAAVLAAPESLPLFWHTLSASMPPVSAAPALPRPFAEYLAR